MYTINTMKNITLSASEELIEQARRKAASKGTTLNQEFRVWLKSQSISGQERAQRYREIMARLDHIDAGRKFTREEMNER